MIWLFLAATVVLLLANAFFVGSEFALMAARRTHIEHLAGQGDARANIALDSIRELSLMLAGAQLGITMASLGLGAVSEPAIARLVEVGVGGIVELPPAVLHSISFFVALTIVVFLHMVVGEMAPKNVAIAEPERSALWLALPFRVYATIFRPFLWLLNMSANGILRLLRVEPREELMSVHTADEIAVMVEESAKHGAIRALEQRLLTGAVALGGRDAAAVMVPRTELTAVPLGATVTEIERLVLETGHSRIAVYGRDLDEIIGFVHSKDLLKLAADRRDEPLPRRFIRPMMIVPESRKLLSLLLDMRRRRQHVTLVVDEHGGTAGIATLEDLLEELVGEIRDEHDMEELNIERLGENRYLVPGSLHITDVADYLGIDLPEGEYETIAGFIMSRLGRIPQRRDWIEHDGWRFQVRQMHRRRVVQITIEPVAGAGAPPEESRLADIEAAE